MAGTSSISLRSLLSRHDVQVIERDPTLKRLLERDNVSLAELRQRALEADQYQDSDVANVLRSLVPKAQQQLLAPTPPAKSAPKSATSMLRWVATAAAKIMRERGDEIVSTAAASPAEAQNLSLMERAWAVACALDNQWWAVKQPARMMPRRQAERIVGNVLRATPESERRELAELVTGFGVTEGRAFSSREPREFVLRHLTRAALFSPARAFYEIPAAEIQAFHLANTDPERGNLASLSVQERILLLRALVFDRNGYAQITRDTGVDETALVLAIVTSTPTKDRDLFGDRIRPYLRALDRVESLHRVKHDILKFIGPHAHVLSGDRDMLVLRRLAKPRTLDKTSRAELAPRMRLEQAAVRASHYVRQMGHAGVGFQIGDDYGEKVTPTKLKLFLIHDDGSREDITGLRPLALDADDTRTVEQVLERIGERLHHHVYGETAPGPLPPPYLHLGAPSGLPWQAWSYDGKTDTVAPQAALLARLLGSPRTQPADVLSLLTTRLAHLGVPAHRLRKVRAEGDAINMDVRFAELLLKANQVEPIARAVDFRHFSRPENQTRLTEGEARHNLEVGAGTFTYDDFETRKGTWPFVRWFETDDDHGEVRFVMPYLAYTRLDRVIAEPDADLKIGDISPTDVKKALEFRLASQFDMPADVTDAAGPDGEPWLTVPVDVARALLDTTVLRWRTAAPGYDPYNLYIGERIASGVYVEDKFAVEHFLSTKGVRRENLRFIETNGFELAIFSHDSYVFVASRGTWGASDIFVDARARAAGFDEYITIDPKTGAATLTDTPPSTDGVTVRTYVEQHLGIDFDSLPPEIRSELKNAHFHYGFFTQVLGGLPDTMAKLRELDPDKTKSHVLLGHSKGGAEITILAMFLTLAGYKIKRQVTIGSARALDPSAARAYDRLGLGRVHDRVRNGQDIVPWVPLHSGVKGIAPGGYRHVGRELFINQEGRIITDMPLTEAGKALVAGGGNLSLVNDHLDAGYLRNAESNLYSLYVPLDRASTAEVSDISLKDEALAAWRLAVGLWKNRGALFE